MRLRLRVTPDPRRDVLADRMPRWRAMPSCGFMCCSRRISARPATAMSPRSEPSRGRRMLWAEQGPFGAGAGRRGRASSATRSAGPAPAMSAASDGWQDFARNGALTWEYEMAGPGNVALIGELPRQAVLALGFGSSAEAAADAWRFQACCSRSTTFCSSRSPNGRRGRPSAANAGALHGRSSA